ncbi:MAG: glutathione S-transferase family protein, partial [Pontibacterium sp.]
VPVLWDKKTNTIVNNESAEIIRIFNTAFNDVGATSIDLYPEAEQAEIDELNTWIYDLVNNGVYRAGFATTQEAYDEAVYPLFEALDKLEERLTKQRFLIASGFTEADIRLFTTLVRFDPVYVGHFKCDLKRIADYPALSGYIRDIYQIPGVASTVNMAHIRDHYHLSHPTINPYGILPVGSRFDLSAPSRREHLGELSL